MEWWVESECIFPVKRLNLQLQFSSPSRAVQVENSMGLPITLSFIRAMFSVISRERFEEMIIDIQQKCPVYVDSNHVVDRDLNDQYLWNIIVSKCYQVFCNHDQCFSRKIYKEYFDYLQLHHGGDEYFLNMTEKGLQGVQNYYDMEPVYAKKMNPESILLIKRVRETFNRKIMYHIDKLFIEILYNSRGYLFASKRSVVYTLLDKKVALSIWGTHRARLQKGNIRKAIEYSNQIPMQFFDGDHYREDGGAILWLKLSCYAAAYHLAQSEGVKCSTNEWHERVSRALKLCDWLNEKSENIELLRLYLPKENQEI